MSLLVPMNVGPTRPTLVFVLCLCHAHASPAHSTHLNIGMSLGALSTYCKILG